MIKFKALNEGDSDEEASQSFQCKKPSTKEAEEAEAFSLYNNALSLLKDGEKKEAKEAFLDLLHFDLIREAAPLTSQDEGLVHPGLILKYSAYKNLATIAFDDDSKDEALEYFIQAVMVDSSDVTVWYKIGKLALQLHQYSLAKHGFEQGLQCNPRHWPCLDHLISVLYALNNYEVCLVYLARALERDPDYVKGKAFLHRIFSEQPSLRRDSLELLSQCDGKIYDVDSEVEEAEEYIQDALVMRNKRRERAKVPDLPTVNLVQPLHSFSWRSLGESLVMLYDHIEQTIEKASHKYNPYNPRVSFCSQVDLSAVNITSIEETVAMASEMAPILPSLVPEEPPASIPMEVASSQDVTDTECLSDMQGDIQTDPMEDMPFSQEERLESVMNVASKVSRKSLTTNQYISGARRGRKRKFHPLGEAFSAKRRSTRVRNTVTKKDESVDYHELLAKFLPISMLEILEVDEMDDTSVLDALDASLNLHGNQEEGNMGGLCEAGYLTTGEQNDVQEFIEKHQTNCGVIHLINDFLILIASKSNMIWPDGMVDIFMKAYSRLRKHFEYPNYMCKDECDDRIKDMARMCLVYQELQLDHWLISKAKAALLHDNSPQIGSPVSVSHVLGKEFPGKYTSSDLAYLSGLSIYRDILGADFVDFGVRVHWVTARFKALQADMNWAADCFCRAEEFLEFATPSNTDETKPLIIKLPNCKHDSVISLVTVEKQIDSLKRCQSLEAVQKLYEAGTYDRVVELLLQTFTQSELPEIRTRERNTQLLLLQDSLLHLEDYKRCLIWSEVSLHEAVNKYFGATSQIKQDWLETLITLMEGLTKCLSVKSSNGIDMPSKTLVRLTHNLTRIVHKSMDTPSSSEMAISTMLPWKVLYHLIKNEEKRLGPLEARMDEEILPCSLTLLNVAHEYLGRRNWCVKCNGELLHFIVDMVLKELANESPDHPNAYKEDMQMTLEQCFYCLYGHPNKRTKAKHLEDHNAEGILLTWKRSIQVFEYFKPKSMPEYDSYKTSTVSAELENLLRKISTLVPPQDTGGNTIDSVTSYMDGTIDTPPRSPEGYKPPPVVKELFYLLADYYFKNKETVKAIKFYMHDVCYNPYHFDSWAGLALARQSRLETKLASHELRPDASLQRQSICTLRCFKRALELDDSNSKMWIEYGSMAYQLHSFASRQLKQKSWYSMSEDLLVQAENNKHEMLDVVEDCYKRAADIEGEEGVEQWLHHYMLGKLAEKLERVPSVYMEHYKLAAQYLHKDNAKYPKKIMFYNSSPHLAIEAVEIYYRLHVSMLKYLMRNYEDLDADTLDLFEGYLQDAADGPFANCIESKRSDRKYSESQMEQDESSSSLPATSTVETETKGDTQVPKPDHTYHKEKMTSESSEHSSQECDVLNSSQESIVLSPVRSSLNTSVSRTELVSTPALSTIPTTTVRSKPAIISDKSEHGLIKEPPPPTRLNISEIDFITPHAVPPQRQPASSGSEHNIVTPSPDVEAMDIDTPITCTSKSMTVTSKTSGPLPVMSLSKACTENPRTLSSPFMMDNILGTRESENHGSTSLPVEAAEDHQAEVVISGVGLISSVPQSKGDKSSSCLDPGQANSPMEISQLQASDLPAELSFSVQDIAPDTLQVAEKTDLAEPKAGDSRSTLSATEDSNDKDDVRILCVDGANDDKPEDLTAKNDNVSNGGSQQSTHQLQNADPETSLTQGVGSSQEKKDSTNGGPEDNIPVAENKPVINEQDSELKYEMKIESDVKGQDIEQLKLESNVRAQDNEQTKPTETKKDTEVNIKSEAGNKENKVAGQNTIEVRFRKLVEGCIKALTLCLQRLPQHHKSLYRLAYIYMHCPPFKNVQYAYDLLLGNNNWIMLDHMPCPGLLQERKQNNFFQGLWKMPLEEIDRSGSFAAHLTTALQLTFKVLEIKKQSRTLYHFHLQLSRTPDAGKKYIRDCDRLYLASQAYDLCVCVLEVRVSKAPAIVTVSAKDEGLILLMEVHKVWQFGSKLNLQVDRLSKLFLTAYKAAKQIKTGDDSTVMEAATKFCQQQQQVQMAAKVARREAEKPPESQVTGPPSSTTHNPAEGDQQRPRLSDVNQARVEKFRQELMKARMGSKSPTHAPTPSSSSRPSASDIMAQYSKDQMATLAALSQLYTQSDLTYAYAASLQAMAGGLYDGYNPYNLGAAAGLDSSMAQTLMAQNAALAAAYSQYAGYSMLSPDMLTALAQTSGSSPVNRSPSRSPSSYKSPPSAMKSLTSSLGASPVSKHSTVASSPSSSTYRPSVSKSNTQLMSKSSQSLSHKHHHASDPSKRPSSSLASHTASGQMPHFSGSSAHQRPVHHAKGPPSSVKKFSGSSYKHKSHSSPGSASLAKPSQYNYPGTQKSTGQLPAPQKYPSYSPHQSTSSLTRSPIISDHNPTSRGGLQSNTSVAYSPTTSNRPPINPTHSPSTQSPVPPAAHSKFTTMPAPKSPKIPQVLDLSSPKVASLQRSPRPSGVPPGYGSKSPDIEGLKRFMSSSSMTSTPSRNSCTSVSPGRDSSIESQDVVIISSSQESEED